MSKKDDDRRAYEERAAEIRRQIAEGKRIEQIMAEKVAERARKLIEQNEQEGK